MSHCVTANGGKELRGLSLTQPWAHLVAIGAKRLETRSWSTRYRGLVAIHAASGFPRECQALCRRPPFSHYIADVGSLARGAIVGIGYLAAVYESEVARGCISEDELAFGDFSDGRYAWKLTSVQWCRTPVACKGALGLWRVPAHIEARAWGELEVLA